jgi:PAS domain S-box-containing protein
VKALLIEDNPADVGLVRLALEEALDSLELFVADDGVKALEFLKREGQNAGAARPDFVLLDLKLPRKSGLEVLSEMKRDPALRRIPVIVLTSSTAAGDIARAYELQAAAYFAKPVSGLGPVLTVILAFIEKAELPGDTNGLDAAISAESGSSTPIYPPLRSASERFEDMSPERRLAAIVESSVDPIVGTTVDGTITAWNRAAETLYGYTEQEALGTRIDRIVPEQDRAELMMALAAVGRGQSLPAFDSARIDRHGHRIDVSSSMSPVRDRYGNVVGVSLVSRDVTGRKLLEDRFRVAVEASPSAMVMVDAQGRIILVNEETERLFGYPRAELIGRSVEDLVPERFRGAHPHHRTQFMVRPEARAMGAGRDLFGLRKDGSEFPIEIGLRPTDTTEGTAVLSAIVDITERKQAEERFRLAVESSPSAMVMVDADGVMVLVNAETERLFGYQRDEMIGKPIELLVPERFRTLHPHLRSVFVARPEARAMGAGRELHGLRKDGTEFPIEIGLNPIETSTGTLVLSAIVDITERKQADERFRLAVESSPSAMVMVASGGQIVLINEEAERLFGYRREELVGKSIEMLVPKRYAANHPRLRAGFVANPEKRSLGAGRNLYGVRKDGTEIPVEIGLTPIRAGQDLLVLSAIVDITERTRAEEIVARQTRELERSNAELQQFAYVASHDLQEPLRTVASYTQLLERRYGDQLDADARTYIKFAREGALRMQQLLEGLLAYSRLGTHRPEPVPTESTVALDHAIQNLKVAIDESGAEIVRGELPTVAADPSQLVEIFQNLVGNAIKFCGGKRPRVEIAARRADGEWVFSVVDDGIGIDATYFDRIFQVFQRLHHRDDYPGTGIGLAICKRIAERLGGRIWVESTPGAGATFSFSVPDRRSDAAASEAASTDAPRS